MQAPDLQQCFEVIDLAPEVRLHLFPTRRFKTVTCQLFVRRPLGPQAGRFALIPMLLRRGTRKLNTQAAIIRHLEHLYGATLVGNILKIGEQQVLYLKLQVPAARYLPASDGDVFEEAVHFLKDLLLDPRMEGTLFPRSVFEQERHQLLWHLRSLITDREGYAMERCTRLMCEGEPYAWSEFGTEEELARLTPEEVTEEWRRMLAERPVDVFLHGDFEPERLAAVVRERFQLERQLEVGPEPPVPAPPPTAVRRFEEQLPGLRQARLVLGYRTEQTARTPGFAALQLMSGMLGGYPHSRLFQRVREQAGLAYAIHAHLEKTKGLMYVVAGLQPGTDQEAMRLIAGELAALSEGGFEQEELELTRQALLRNHEALVDSPGRTISYFYALHLNGRVRPILETMDRLRGLGREEVAAAARAVHLDTVYLLA